MTGVFPFTRIYALFYEKETLTWFLTDESAGMQTDFAKLKKKDFYKLINYVLKCMYYQSTQCYNYFDME